MTVGRDDWDVYWRQQNSVTKTYGKIASAYRNSIIPRSLIKTLNDYVAQNGRILHAGAGEGEVDINIATYWNLFSIDFSAQAISKHHFLHSSRFGVDRISQADIFELPFPSKCFDAVFNLGVMEHFTEIEIYKALEEMKRVIRVGGRIIIYWPPVWGLSVFVLRIAKWLLKLKPGERIILHPPEINLFRSTRNLSKVMSAVGLTLEKCSFGIGDLFTHQIIVARRNY